MSLTAIHPKRPDPILPMSWLDWRRDGEDYVGGDYRIRLLAPHRWEVLRNDRRLFVDARLSGALARTEDHYRDRLRLRDLFTWAGVLLGSILGGMVVETWRVALGLWGFLLLTVSLYGAVSAIVHFYAALSRNRFDPYRRRAPWETRGWWQR